MYGNGKIVWQSKGRRVATKSQERAITAKKWNVIQGVTNRQHSCMPRMAMLR